MTFQLTTSRALKSFAGAAIFGLSMDAASLVSRHVSDVAWFALREVVGLLFWGVIAGWQATHTTVLGHDMFFLGCPLQLLHSLGSLAQWLCAAV
jgi:hypothetical protein